MSKITHNYKDEGQGTIASVHKILYEVLYRPM